MIKTHKFLPADRYLFDFKFCSPKKGFAQIDTCQDAGYYGTWANPYTLDIINYCEGDVYSTKCENEQEFIQEIASIKQWNETHGYEFKGIDPGLNELHVDRWKEIGLAEYLH